MMNCIEALRLLYDIIDKEASEVDTKEVQEHLEHCKDCFEKYRLEESIQSLINEKIRLNHSNLDTSCNFESLKSNILTKLDEVDNSGSKEAGNSNFFSITKIFVSSAALVVLVISAFLISHFVSHYKHYIPLEEAHWQAESNLATYSSNNSSNSQVSLISKIHAARQYDIENNVNGFTLIGGKAEKLMGVEMEHLVYKNNGDVVSVFIAPADQFKIPSDLESEKIVRDQIEMYAHDCRGCRLVYHKAGSVVIITATTEPDLDLVGFIPGHAVPAI